MPAEPPWAVARELGQRLAGAEVDAALHREPRHGAVHRPRVEVAEAEALREAARHRALAGAGRPVDRDNHRFTTVSRSS